MSQGHHELVDEGPRRATAWPVLASVGNLLQMCRATFFNMVLSLLTCNCVGTLSPCCCSFARHLLESSN